MVNGEIHYARFPVDVQAKFGTDIDSVPGIVAAVFPSATYEIIDIKTVNISGGGGTMKLVCIVFARLLA